MWNGLDSFNDICLLCVRDCVTGCHFSPIMSVCQTASWDIYRENIKLLNMAGDGNVDTVAVDALSCWSACRLAQACTGHKCAYSKAGLATQRHQSLLISASWYRFRGSTAVPERHPVASGRHCIALYKKLMSIIPQLTAINSNQIKATDPNKVSIQSIFIKHQILLDGCI